jgi:arylsulfatase A-like enzyme
MTNPRRPNVLVVVSDCGRSFDFPGGIEPVSPMPFLESLGRESVIFPNTISPSPWTVPGHASLFTGLYPWEHKVHMKSRLHLEASTPTLASLLRDRGYATLSLSANGFIGPEFGLLKGFQDAAWGVWWEKFVRIPGLSRPLRSSWISETPPDPGDIQDDDGGSFPSPWGGRILHRFVEGKDPVWMGPAVNLLNLGIRTSRASPQDRPLPVSPWIEPTLESWLGRQDPAQPVFCFVNFLETHEPYVADPRDFPGPWSWGRHALQRTDKFAFYAGRWKPRPSEFQRLRRLYRSALRSLDRRFHAVVEAFRRSGRWKNTLFILTGDHGQAFGENGYLFHACRLWEGVVRVPLWIRFPEGQGGGRTCPDWASLVDILPTVLQALGEEGIATVSGRSLRDVATGLPARPLYALADGLQGKTHVQKVAPECVPQWDGPWVGVYRGPRKLLFDVSEDRFRAYRVDEDPREERDRFVLDRTDWSEAAEEARNIASRLGASAPPLVTPEVDQLLRSWGYD